MQKIRLTEKPQHQNYTVRGVPLIAPFPLYEPQMAYVEYVIGALQQGHNALVQSPTGTGKTISLLTSTLSWLAHEHSGGRHLHTRIIYTSRTHGQLKQAIAQLSCLSYELRMAVLSSRDQSCINEELSLLSQGDKDLQCRIRVALQKGVPCNYYRNEKQLSDRKGVGRIMDVEEANLRGKLDGICPYYSARHSLAVANLIFMPYNYLFRPQRVAEEGGAVFERSIIIFDEAHNIQGVAEEAKQVSLSYSSLQRVLVLLSELREEKLGEGSQKARKSICTGKSSEEARSVGAVRSTLEDIEASAAFVEQFRICLSNLELGANGQTSTWTVPEFFGRMKKEQLSPFLEEMGGKARTIRSDINFKPIGALEAWSSFLDIAAEAAKVLTQGPSEFLLQLSSQGSDVYLKLHCLEPARGFQQVKNLKPLCVILTSGTMTPLKMWPLELNMAFGDLLACEHILSPGQVQASVLCRGPSGENITLNFENRSNARLFDDIGQTILEVVRRTQHGVIVFLSSYLMLDLVRNHLTASHTLTKIYEHKPIFYESKSSVQFKTVLENYLKEAQTAKGAVLFALIRGKVSEGLDFSNEKCRAVMIVGVPYPAARDVKVMAKMKYLDEVSRLGEAGQKRITGKQWYLTETIRSINQGIGRLIRSKKDFGAIYLVDDRFARPELLEHVSSWAKPSLKIFQDYQDFREQVISTNYSFDSTPAPSVSPLLSHHQATLDALVGTVRTVKGTISRAANPNQLTLKPPSLTQLIQEIRKNPPQKKKASFEQMVFRPPTRREECVICLLKKKLIKNTACVHMICEECWEQCLQNDLRCPLCRERVREKFLIRDE